MRKEPYVIHPKGNFFYKVENTYRNFATARSTQQTIWFLEILIENGIFYIKSIYTLLSNIGFRILNI